MIKKPKCPICELDIKFKKTIVHSTSTSPSALGGEYKSSKYVCAGGYDVCEVALYMYITATSKSIQSPRTDNYRYALKRYIEFIDFCIDNDIQSKLFAYCDKNGKLSDKDKGFLLDSARINGLNSPLV